MNKYIFLLGIILLISPFANSQTIDNIQHNREGNKVLITYSISDARFYQSFNIDLYISFNNGKDFIGPLKDLAGDVGENISAGKNKIIYWDVFREFDELKGEIIFDIRAKIIKNIEKKYFILYQGNNITPFGLKIGHLGLFGWYVSGFINTNLNKYDYDYNNNVILNFPETNYYEITDQKKYGRYSLVAGMNYQFLKNMYFNIGMGYGYKESIWEIDEYTYENDELLKQSYLKNISDSYGGIEVEAGLMYSYKRIIIATGINSLNFERLDWNIGVGYCF